MTERLTPDILREMRRNMPDSAAAMALDHRARTIEESNTRNFAELGIVCREVDDRELWRFITKTGGEMCHSFDDWLLDAMPVSRSQAYSARKVAQRLEHLPMEERSAISPGNLKTLAEVDDPKITKSRPILDDAKKMKPGEFRDKIMREHPEQHILPRQPMLFKPDKEQREDIEAAMVLAKGIDGAETREEQLHIIARYYTDSQENKKLLAELQQQSTVH